MNDWNPNLYRQFEKQRTQPARDLVNSLDLAAVHRILDIGCGPGNSTELLKNKWPDATVIGIDSSPSMIEQAVERVPDAQFLRQDATADLSALGDFDLVFSNAALQWMPNHNALIGKLFGMLKQNGALALQIPNVTNMGIKKAIDEVVSTEKWQPHFRPDRSLTYYSLAHYYEICAPLSHSFFLWATNYYHVLDSHERILSWYKSTGLRPYLAQLDASLQSEFESDVLDKIKEEYAVQSDGNVLFVFHRQFIVMYNKEQPR